MRPRPEVWGFVLGMLVLSGASAPAEQGAVEKALQLKNSGDHAAAVRVLTGYLKQTPADARAHYVLAWEYIALGDKAKAADQFRLTLTLKGSAEDVAEARAALRRMGEPASGGQPPAAGRLTGTGEAAPGKAAGEAAAVGAPPASGPGAGPASGPPKGAGGPAPAGMGSAMPAPGMEPERTAAAATRAAGLAALGLVPLLLIAGVVVVFIPLCVMFIADKTDTPNGWLAWVPIANTFLVLQIARKPLWWFVLLLIPGVNLIISLLVFMGLAAACGKPGWLGILMMLVIPTPFVLAYLAFSKGEPVPQPATTSESAAGDVAAFDPESLEETGSTESESE